jgi:hypothetical protein
VVELMAKGGPGPRLQSHFRSPRSFALLQFSVASRDDVDSHVSPTCVSYL